MGRAGGISGLVCNLLHTGLISELSCWVVSVGPIAPLTDAAMLTNEVGLSRLPSEWGCLFDM